MHSVSAFMSSVLLAWREFLPVFIEIDVWPVNSKMTIITPDWRRRLRMKIWAEGMDRTFLSKVITASIIFGIVGLTIMNTLFMSLYERMFEFGVLRAIGTRPLRMALMILLEGGCLAIISIIIGSAVGFFFSWLFSVYGIDYRGIEFAGTTINELIYPVMNVRQYLLNPLYVLFFTLVAALYPAWYAARLTPAKAMKRSL